MLAASVNESNCLITPTVKTEELPHDANRMREGESNGEVSLSDQRRCELAFTITPVRMPILGSPLSSGSILQIIEMATVRARATLRDALPARVSA
jgi:hypothetical protein